MSESKPVEIFCSACGADTLLVRKPKYEGFTRAGDQLMCASCGHEYASEADVPFRKRATVAVFTEADRAVTPEIFREEEKGRICRHCVNYLINPFTQWCSLHRKEVEATDSCDRFAARPPPPPPKHEPI